MNRTVTLTEEEIRELELPVYKALREVKKDIAFIEKAELNLLQVMESRKKALVVLTSIWNKLEGVVTPDVEINP